MLFAKEAEFDPGRRPLFEVEIFVFGSGFELDQLGGEVVFTASEIEEGLSHRALAVSKQELAFLTPPQAFDENASGLAHEGGSDPGVVAVPAFLGELLRECLPSFRRVDRCRRRYEGPVKARAQATSRRETVTQRGRRRLSVFLVLDELDEVAEIDGRPQLFASPGRRNIGLRRLVSVVAAHVGSSSNSCSSSSSAT